MQLPQSWLPKILSVLVFGGLFPIHALAIEIQPFFGPLKYDHIEGCCQSGPARSGTGVLVRFDSADYNEWDFIGYTDRKWSEFSVLKPFYFLGDSLQSDPSIDSSVQITRLNRWIGIVSLGGGYFVHSSRTRQYDLPVLVSGFSLNAHTQIRYTINDTWGVVGALHLGLSAAADERGFLSGMFLGINFRP